MATGRIGVTPTLGTRWSKAPAGGTTSLSGLDDNSVSLVYSVGYEQVYRNGVLLSRTNDYTATSGTSITLIDATITGDIIEVFANELVPLTDAISKGQFTAKGTLLSASAASTPAVLGVGSNDQVLTADSTTTTGLKWATPAAGGMTLISTTTLSGASTTISFTSTGYNALVFECYNIEISTNTQWNWQPNATNNICTYLGDNHTGTAVGSRSANIDTFIASSQGATWKGSDTNNAGYLFIDNPASSTSFKPFQWWSTWVNSDASTKSTFTAIGAIRSTTALSSMSLQPSSGTFSAGTVKLYGVK